MKKLAHAMLVEERVYISSTLYSTTSWNLFFRSKFLFVTAIEVANTTGHRQRSSAELSTKNIVKGRASTIFWTLLNITANVERSLLIMFFFFLLLYIWNYVSFVFWTVVLMPSIATPACEDDGKTLSGASDCRRRSHVSNK